MRHHKKYVRKNTKRLYGDRFSVTVEPTFDKRYGKTLANRGFYKKKLDTRFDTHCIKTGVQLWRRGRDSNPCGVAPKRFSRPPRYDRFDTSPYMKLSFDRNHQIFNCFRNSFRNALLCCCRCAEKVRCCKAFQGFCDRCARKFSRPPRYDRFDIPPDNCKLFYKLLINQCKYYYTIMLLICQYSF